MEAEKISYEDVDKIFDCFSRWYGKRWIKYMQNDRLKELARLMWKNGLYGLNKKQIKSTLQILKLASKDKERHPPHVLEFYRIAKSHKLD